MIAIYFFRLAWKWTNENKHINKFDWSNEKLKWWQIFVNLCIHTKWKKVLKTMLYSRYLYTQKMKWKYSCNEIGPSIETLEKNKHKEMSICRITFEHLAFESFTFLPLVKEIQMEIYILSCSNQIKSCLQFMSHLIN